MSGTPLSMDIPSFTNEIRELYNIANNMANGRVVLSSAPALDGCIMAQQVQTLCANTLFEYGILCQEIYKELLEFKDAVISADKV